jgi:hypothetical protein
VEKKARFENLKEGVKDNFSRIAHKFIDIREKFTGHHDDNEKKPK